MQDRFRFRIWWKKEECWVESMMLCDMGFLAMQNGTDIEEDGFDEKDLIIQQCTGLKDKNGKLIFEGDIIVIPNQYPFYDYKDRDNKKIDLNETCGKIMGESVLNYIGIVEWIYSTWQYVYHCVNPQKQGISEGINNLLNEIGYEDGQKTEFEIIGNIYENKDLLKERK